MSADSKKIDPKGTWYMTAQGVKYAMEDPGEKAVIMPGVATKITVTPWVVMQVEAGVLVQTDEDGVPVKVEKPANAPAASPAMVGTDAADKIAAELAEKLAADAEAAAKAAAKPAK